MRETSAVINSILHKWNSDSSCLISMLLDLQDEYNYLPQDALKMLAERLGIPLINVYSVATFYKVFSLSPRGKHLINACLGTACHVRGGPNVLDELKRQLHINPGETTEDNLFTLETVRCLGCCALGPVVVIDNTYHSHVSTEKVGKILEVYRKAMA